MAKTPYLNRRGNNLYFRITVPIDIRSALCLREITRTLRTQHFNEAVSLALMLGARVRTIFNKVRYMSQDNADEARINASKVRAEKVLRVIEKARESGAQTLQAIAVFLNEKTSIRTPRGSLWTRSAVQRVLHKTIHD